jgi:TRAP-type C4-dicarboxylate transport system substrate-binding protein
MGFKIWCKEITKRTNDRIKFDIFWASSLIKAQDAFQGTGQGLVDIYMDIPVYHLSTTPLMTVSELGFMFRDILIVAVLIAFPQIVLWLPNMTAK